METNSGLPGAGAVGGVLTPLQRARLKAYGSRTEVSDSEEERQRYVEAPPVSRVADNICAIGAICRGTRRFPSCKVTYESLLWPTRQTRTCQGTWPQLTGHTTSMDSEGDV